MASEWRSCRNFWYKKTKNQIQKNITQQTAQQHTQQKKEVTSQQLAKQNFDNGSL